MESEAQSPLTHRTHISILETYKQFLDQEQLSPSDLLNQAISELMAARVVANDKSLYQIRKQKEAAIIRIQQALSNAIEFIEEMNLLVKYGAWLVIKEEVEALKHEVHAI